MRAHEIDYEIHGAEMQFVEIALDPNETVLAEAGAMMHMDSSIRMETQFGDGTQDGLFGKLLGAGKRLLTGESLFLTTFTQGGGGKGRVAFAAPYPGRIIAVDLAEIGTLICQKDSYLCSAMGIEVGIAFTKRFGAGLFGGEGFILQKLTGDGFAFVHAGGTIVSRDLKAGESIKVDTGCIVAFQESVSYDIQMVKGVKNWFFGGEGLFLANLEGPGRIWLQSLPFSRMANRVLKAAGGFGSSGSKGEGSVLGGLGNLFETK